MMMLYISARESMRSRSAVVSAVFTSYTAQCRATAMIDKDLGVYLVKTNGCLQCRVWHVAVRRWSIG